MQTKRRELFTTVRTEGAILPADLLQRIADGDSGLEGLKPEDFHRAGERLNEVINGAWNRLLGQWQTFQAALAKLPENDAATSVTRERWLLPLFRELDYGRLATATAIEINGKSYPISHGWQNTPIHLVGWRIEMDRRTAGVAGAARTSPHSLLQELLNQSDEQLWGFVSNGQRLRILRDNISLTRQAFVEFDLEAMMDGEVYADFALVWLLCHQSRVEGERPEQCWLEKWSKNAQETGTRALDDLRTGVEDAIKALARGFLAHPANAALRQKLRDGGQQRGLDTQDYYRQVLRLVYRLLFLFAAEDRGLLLLPSANEKTRANYSHYYSTARLRRLAERHRGTRHGDLYQGLAVVMQKLGMSGGCPELGLPALGGFLWSDRAVLALADCRIANTDFLEAVRALAFTVDGNVLRAVDYKNLGAEELGSVYESLLELHPKINADAATFELDVAAGHERKTTGSYYTPTSLITCLLDSALDPVLDEAAKKPTAKEAEAAILALKVCDPACGSGHFLIAAAHRIAKRLAAVRTGDEEPAPEALRQALRDVIGRCIFGVDINPMAVELCKINLWLESLEPGKPLSFLDHHIQCGNSLLGTTPALLNNGIPDEAFVPIEGDEKKLCNEYKKQNRDERRGQKTFFTGGTKPWERMGDFAVSLASLEQADDDSLESIRTKEERYAQLVSSADYLSGRFWADAWCAAFVWKKTTEFDYAITEDVFRRIERNPRDCTPWMRAEIQRLAQQYQLFHWHLAFPQIFRVPLRDNETQDEETGWSGGFDLVLGNPPWERIKLQEKEWFAERAPGIASAGNAATRRKMIERLETDDPPLFAAFLEARRQAEGESVLVRGTGRYPLCGRGDINTYAIFAELKRSLISPTGRVGCIVPSGIATDDTTKFFFQALMETGTLASLYDFENRDAIFPGVHRSYRFCLLTLTGSGRPEKLGAAFVVFARQVSDIHAESRLFRLTAKDIGLINPNSLTCPTFRHTRDAVLAKAVYAKIPIFIKDGDSHGNPWSAELYKKIFDMSLHSSLFLDPDGCDESSTLPLYEAKLMFQFDHRFATYLDDNRQVVEIDSTAKQEPGVRVRSRYRVLRADVAKKSVTNREWHLVFRDITNATNERTVVSCFVPRVAVSDSLGSIILDKTPPPEAACLLANLNSFCLDYHARQKVAGLHLSQFYLRQFPVIAPTSYRAGLPWGSDRLVNWIVMRVLELSYTCDDMRAFAVDCGYDGRPFIWNDERRFLIRCELDAAYFHLYGLRRDDVDYIMETFPIVKRRDEEQHGEYRTKRVILEMYDAMCEAVRTGHPYHTILDPPPGPPAAGLPDWQPCRSRPANWPSHIHAPCHASGTAAAEPPPSPPSNPAAPAVWQMTRGQYQDYCKTHGRTDIMENNRTYWREVESAIQSGKPVPPSVLAEYKQLKNAK